MFFLFFILFSSIFNVYENYKHENLNSLNPCDSFPKSFKNNSDRFIIFVEFNDHLDLVSTFLSPSDRKILKTFIKCYSLDNGLEIGYAFLSRNTPICDLTYWKSSSFKFVKMIKKWDIIIPLDVAEICNSKMMKFNILNQIQSITNISEKMLDINFVTLSTCYSKQCLNIKPKMSNQLLNPVLITRDTYFYEILEHYIDYRGGNLDPVKSPNYFYFFTPLAKNQRLVWPALFAVVLIICFFLIGFFGCLYSLLSFTLIEEDFRRRNDEREWLARNIRHRTPVFDIIENGSINTARSANSFERIGQTTLSTDVTQQSETILGANVTSTKS